MKQNTGSDSTGWGDSIAQSLAGTSDADLNRSWSQLRATLADRFGENLGIEGILFLVGIQESGRGFEPRLKKERKQDLIMFGTHCVFETLGIYRRMGDGEEGVAWERQIDVPKLEIEDQEKLLRFAIIRYFSERDGFDLNPAHDVPPDSTPPEF